MCHLLLGQTSLMQGKVNVSYDSFWRFIDVAESHTRAPLQSKQQRDHDIKRLNVGNGMPEFQQNTHEVSIYFLSAEGCGHLSISVLFYRL